MTAGEVGRVRVAFGVLGPVAAWDGDGRALALGGPRHREVLARLVLARRRVVPVNRLVADLWDEPPAGAVGAVQTFVGALRRELEPGRPPRAPARLLVTAGTGYALRADPDSVDAWRFEAAVDAAAALPPAPALARLGEALELWRGPSYGEYAHRQWARGERSRLAELRLRAVERRAEARLRLGLAAEAVPDLDAHLTEHPWREDAWRLLALALYRSGRQGTRSPCCAGPGRCWPRAWGSTRDRRCAAWRRTYSPRTRGWTRRRRCPPTRAPRPPACGRGRPRRTTAPSPPGPAHGWSRRSACCAISR